jgi:hypothetical protein
MTADALGQGVSGWIATVVSNIGTWMQTVGVIKELLSAV